jgi:excisionase family DNA binding protein
MRATEQHLADAESPTLLTVSQVAKLFQVRTRTIWKWRSSGSLPEPLKNERTVRWKKSDIDEWIGNGCPKR